VLTPRPAFGKTQGDHGVGHDHLDQETSCQYRSDDSDFFMTPESGSTMIAVSTQWHPYYFAKLSARIEKELNATWVQPPFKCGWHAWGTVVRNGVHRGTIYWHSPGGANSTTRMSSSIQTETLLSTFKIPITTHQSSSKRRL
jgi:hypothetical protein